MRHVTMTESAKRNRARNRRRAVADARARALVQWVLARHAWLEFNRITPADAATIAQACGLRNATARTLVMAARAERVTWPAHWRRIRDRSTDLGPFAWDRLDRLVRLAASLRAELDLRTVADVARWLEHKYKVRRPLPVIDAALRGVGVVLPQFRSWHAGTGD